MEYMEAFKKIDDLARDEEFIGYYDYEEAKEREYASLSAEMKEEGLEEGRAEERKAVICKMHKNGMSISDISSILEIDEVEIENLLKI